MVEFMENGNGEFKTTVSKGNATNISSMLKEKGFKIEYDFSVQSYGGNTEVIFYNIECKKVCEEVVNA